MQIPHLQEQASHSEPLTRAWVPNARVLQLRDAWEPGLQPQAGAPGPSVKVGASPSSGAVTSAQEEHTRYRSGGGPCPHVRFYPQVALAQPQPTTNPTPNSNPQKLLMETEGRKTRDPHWQETLTGDAAG